MRLCFAFAVVVGLVVVAAACGGSGSVPDATQIGATQSGETRLTELKLVNTRADLNFPSQIQFRFALRDETGAPIVVPTEDIHVRVFERETGTKKWHEIDETETNLLVRSAHSFQMESFFVLDFTNSIAQMESVYSLSGLDGLSGLDAMASAFRSAATTIPGPHRIGVVEFHDRNADPAVLSELTTDRDTLITAVENLSVLSGSSRLWDAVARGLSLFSVDGEKPGVVKALVVLSDGRDFSSQTTRDEALKAALDLGIQVYAVGIGNVPQETELAEMVRASGGVYYSAPDLGSLQGQVRQLIDDLLGQYMVSYISLREAGSHSVRVEITAQGSTAALETDSLDFGSFYGQDIHGVIGFDPVVVDVTGEKATAYVRAVHVPRDTTAFRFRHISGAPIQVKLESNDSGGLLEGWLVMGPDALGFYDVSSTTPLKFGSFGVLMKLIVPRATEDTTDTLLDFDNTIYQADKRFFHPPYSDDLASRLQSSTIKVLAANAVVMKQEGRYDFLKSFYWWILALGSFVLFGAYLRIAVAGEGRLTLPLESLNGLGTIAVVVLAVLLEGWEGGVALVVGALVIGPPVAYLMTIIARMRRYLVRPQVRMPLEAIAQYNESIRDDPQNADHYYDRGRLYLNIGHFQRAINDYDKALRLNPRHAVAHYLRGQAYGQMGQELQAIEDFNEAIQLNPLLVDAYFARARAYTVLGLEEDASRDVDQAVILGLDPIFLEEVIEDLRRERLVRERAAQHRRRR